MVKSDTHSKGEGRGGERFNSRSDKNDGGRGGEIGICSEPKVTSLMGSPSLNDFTCDRIPPPPLRNWPSVHRTSWDKHKGLVGCQ